jgi:hypothetical protein
MERPDVNGKERPDAFDLKNREALAPPDEL